MAALSSDRIAELIELYIGRFEREDSELSLHAGLGTYLDLLLKWNVRTNLTAIREPEEIVRRHFGESLFLAGHLGPCESLLDFGSGAGFPGIPIQLMRPALKITLAESQGKKAAFLREAIRGLGLRTEVWANRVETMPPERGFDVVTLRAVDSMSSALVEAGKRTERLAVLGTSQLGSQLHRSVPEFRQIESIPVPGTRDAFVYLASRSTAV
jgi:16S rRNA (guanine527-N7)-methyltransferase